ncbi:MAG: hypothetical protein NTX73_17595 [Rhodobacterales bacterium]|nr:hypothetical protein [Rhodobacterales bacterium]
MKTAVLKDRNEMKKAFDAAAAGVQTNDKFTTNFLAFMARPTGLTPILKVVDAAFPREHRKATTGAPILP